MPVQSKRAEILQEAKALCCDDREHEYGPPSENFDRIAVGWSAILGVSVNAPQVALCMSWLKIARSIGTPPKTDTFADGAAYMALAGELMMAGLVVKDCGTCLYSYRSVCASPCNGCSQGGFTEGPCLWVPVKKEVSDNEQRSAK